MGAAWKGILRQMCEKKDFVTVADVAKEAGCSPQAARTVLERCRLYGTIRRDGKRGAAWLYEATDSGRKYIAGLKKKGRKKS